MVSLSSWFLLDTKKDLLVRAGQIKGQTWTRALSFSLRAATEIGEK